MLIGRRMILKVCDVVSSMLLEAGRELIVASICAASDIFGEAYINILYV